MKTTTISALYLLLATPALAAAKTTDPGGMSLMVILFLGLVALIMLLQLMPALIMLGSMFKGAFMKTSAVASRSTGAEG